MADLALAFSQKYEVTILRPHPSRPMNFKFPDFDIKSLPYKVIELDSYVCSRSSLLGRFRESYSMGKYCVKYIKRNRKDIDLIYNAPWQLWGRYMVAKVARKYRIPYITPVQDIYPESILAKLPKWKVLQKIIISVLLPIDVFTLKNSAKIHTISDKMVEYLSTTRKIVKEQFLMVRNWQNENNFIEYLHKDSEEQNDRLFTFMYLGNIGPLAGLEMVIEAFAKADLVKARLVIAGAGSAKEYLLDKASTYPDKYIEFWNVPFGRVAEIQEKADVMLLPVKKGFSSTSIPSKLPAYMFSSKPILASVDADSDTALSILNAKAGWVSTPENVNDLVLYMKTASSTSKEDLAMMGENGFDYAMANFSKKQNLAKLYIACEAVISEYNKNKLQ